MEKYIISSLCNIFDAMKQIELNKNGFVVILENNMVLGVLTDGDIRRSIIAGYSLKDCVKKIINSSFEYVNKNEKFEVVVQKFNNRKINFLPVLNGNLELVNILTKNQFQQILLKGNKLNLLDKFEEVEGVSYEINDRPWGFYKTIFLSQFAQAKLLHVFPNQQLSLQLHKKREEHWVVIKGTGTMTIGESTCKLSGGSYIFIPKTCCHSIKNDSKDEQLIISEVQLGTYFGEDDIIRIADIYGRETSRII